MRKQKPIWLIPLFLILSALAFAQSTGDNQELVGQDFPLAGIDNVFIPYKSPALLGTGHANGVAWVNLWDNKKIQDHYWLMLNLQNLSYAYEYSETATHHLLGMGTELFPTHIFPNFYGGTHYRWEGKDFKDGSFRSALTYRPHGFSSVAISWDNPKKSRPLYSGGIALRPLAFLPGIEDHRLELSVDVDYDYIDTDDDKYEFKKPVLGVNTQLLDGLKLSANYNLEKESLFLGFGLSFGKVDAGYHLRSKKNDNYGYNWLHLTDELFKPLFGITPAKWYKMPAEAEIVSYRAPKHVIGPIKLYIKS